MNRSWLYGAASVAVLTMAGGPTFAQAVPGAAAAPPLAQNATAIEEVIVTARKRAERELDVPVAMTTLTSEIIQRYSVQTFNQIAALTPSLVISDAPSTGGGLIYLRGIGAGANAPSVDQSVSINVDGVPFGQANILRLGQTDLERIEVLKGPQSLFFGKNSPAGVISLTTADPTREFTARLQTGYEFYNEQKFVEGMVSGPLTDSLRGRLVVYASDQNGWFRNAAVPNIPGEANPSVRTAPKQTEYRIRGTLLFQPSDDFDIRLKVSASKVDRKGSGPAANYQTIFCPKGVPQSLGFVPGLGAIQCTADRYYNLGDIPLATAAVSPAFGNGVPFLTDKLFFTSLTANYRPVDHITVTSVTGYYTERGEFVDNFIAGEIASLDSAQTTTYRQFTQELRGTTSFPGPINAMLGAFYGRTGIVAPVAVVFAPPIVPAPTLIDDARYRHLVKTYSLFGQLIFNFTPQWELTAGARWTRDEKDQSGSERFPSALSNFMRVPLTFAQTRATFDDISPEVTLSYKPNRDLNFYGSYREGFQSGGFNQTAFNAVGSDNSFNEEKVRGGEVGAKGRLFDHQLQFASAAYYYKYKGLQLSSYDSASGTFRIQNAGRATIYGVELSGAFAPNALPGLSLRGAVTYNHARYNSFPATCYPGQTIAMGCNIIPVGGVFQAQSLKGKPLVRAMDWSGNVGATYNTTVGRGLKLSASADANYTGPYFAMLEEAPASRQSSFWKLNASIALRSADDAWELALIGNNLTNELNYTIVQGTPLTGFGQGTNGPASLSDLSAVLGDPRTVMVRLTLTDAILRR